MVALLAYGAIAAAAETVAARPPSLTHHRCDICHSDREALVRPAFADVAASYHEARAMALYITSLEPRKASTQEVKRP